MDIKMNKILITAVLLMATTSSNAYLQACQLVAEKAGKSYQIKPNRFASIVSPEELPKSVPASLIERNGMWFIYQASDIQFEEQQCAPQKTNGIEIIPVIYNQTSGHNAVINGVFAIKTYNEKDIHLIADKYNVRKITQLPNRFTAIFDVKPQRSYDELIETLEKDKNIEKMIPLLSEPRYRLR